MEHDLVVVVAGGEAVAAPPDGAVPPGTPLIAADGGLDRALAGDDADFLRAPQQLGDARDL